MQIRKSKLKQIIQEEVDNAKFIDISEQEIIDTGPASQEHGSNSISPANVAGINMVGDERPSLDELVAQEITKALEGVRDRKPKKFNPQDHKAFEKKFKTAWITDTELQMLNMLNDYKSHYPEKDQQDIYSYFANLYGRMLDQANNRPRDPSSQSSELDKITEEPVDEDWGNKYSLHQDSNPTTKRVAIVVGRTPTLDEEEKENWIGDVDSTGQWTDITPEELRAKIKTAHKEQAAYEKEHDHADPEITKRLHQMNFSLRAKTHDLDEESGEMNTSGNEPGKMATATTGDREKDEEEKQNKVYRQQDKSDKAIQAEPELSGGGILDTAKEFAHSLNPNRSGTDSGKAVFTKKLPDDPTAGTATTLRKISDMEDAARKKERGDTYSHAEALKKLAEDIKEAGGKVNETQST
tara:strand:+ start:2584 stop:3813 length:1230 start_codon:yes stop_codon:yes gene_type:complete